MENENTMKNTMTIPAAGQLIVDILYSSTQALIRNYLTKNTKNAPQPQRGGNTKPCA